MRLIANLIALAVALGSGAGVAHGAGVVDTTLPGDIAYSGYRLHVRDVTVLKQRRGRFLISCDVVNTGRRPVAMGPGFPVRFLQTVFDESLLAGGLAPLGLPIRAALTDSREKFGVGEWREDLEFWVDPESVADEPELATDDFERRRVRPRRPTQTVGEPADREIDAADLVASAAIITPQSAFAHDSEPCSDLAVTVMRVAARGDGNATVHLTVTNLGTATLDGDSLPDRLPLDVFLGGAAEISGSSVKVHGLNLTERIREDGEGNLAPGASLKLVERVDIRKATRYTSMLTARLDGNQALPECEETNNEASTLLAE